MQRESTFRVGGALTVALGVLLGIALGLAGAGVGFFGAWLSAGICVGLGVFFLYVAHDEARTRREYLAHEGPDSVESGRPPDRG